MIRVSQLLLAAVSAALLQAQTAEELVQNNILAKGGIEKIKSIKTYRMTGRMQQGSFSAQIGRESMAPDMIRETFTIQGMTEIDSYDGTVGWKISPFQGRKNPELMGEDELRQLVEDGSARTDALARELEDVIQEFRALVARARNGISVLSEDEWKKAHP